MSAYAKPSAHWHRMSEVPDRECTCHVLIKYRNRDQGRTEYTSEPDTYAVELAKSFGHQPGFCKEDRWPERESLVGWHYFPGYLEDAAAAIRSGKVLYKAPDGYVWHSVDEVPKYEGMYHILAVRTDKKTGIEVVYTEQDLYAHMIAIEHGRTPGFNFMRSKLEKGKMLAWAMFPVPPKSFMPHATRPFSAGYRKILS